MALDCACNSTGLAFIATQEFLVTYCLTFVCFILFVVPFRVHFTDISWKLFRLHIFTGIFVKTLCIWNITIGLYWAACECGHFQAPMPKLRKDKHAQGQSYGRINMHRINSDYNLYHHQKMNIWKRPNQDKRWS